MSAQHGRGPFLTPAGGTSAPYQCRAPCARLADADSPRLSRPRWAGLPGPRGTLDIRHQRWPPGAHVGAAWCSRPTRAPRPSAEARPHPTRPQLSLSTALRCPARLPEVMLLLVGRTQHSHGGADGGGPPHAAADGPGAGRAARAPLAASHSSRLDGPDDVPCVPCHTMLCTPSSPRGARGQAHAGCDDSDDLRRSALRARPPARPPPAHIPILPPITGLPNLVGTGIRLRPEPGLKRMCHKPIDCSRGCPGDSGQRLRRRGVLTHTNF